MHQATKAGGRMLMFPHIHQSSSVIVRICWTGEINVQCAAVKTQVQCKTGQIQDTKTPLEMAGAACIQSSTDQTLRH